MPPDPAKSDSLLSIKDLSVRFTVPAGLSRVIENINLDIRKGEILGLVGETGCGKSVLARTILRLIPQPPGIISSGRIIFSGTDILTLDTNSLRTLRGNEISMIFQEPMNSLNPVYTIGNQMTEVIRLHQKVSKQRAKEIAAEMLSQVRLPDPEQMLKKYPHELSGGMRQRAMIALALSCRPRLLIADEPTTALDVTVQGQVLAILQDLARKNDLSVLFITHDMGVVAQLCDRVAVMYAGTIAEIAPVQDLFAAPFHPYTRGLIAAIPGFEGEIDGLSAIPGTVPGLVEPPPGCRFHPRCDACFPPCQKDVPPLFSVGPGHGVACHLYYPEKGI